MKTTLEIKNKIAGIYSSTIISIHFSEKYAYSDQSIIEQPIGNTLRECELKELSAIGINFRRKSTDEVLFLIKEWLDNANIA